jgi:hypothetical protein
MGSFVYRLELEDGSPAEPPTLRAAVPNWRAGDTIPLGRKTLRVIDTRDDDADQRPVLIVEGTPGARHYDAA